MSSETEQRLVQALTEHLRAEDLLKSGDFVGDWIMNVYVPSFDRGEESAYVLVMAGSRLPDHVAIGLLSNALDRVRGIGDYADDD